MSIEFEPDSQQLMGRFYTEHHSWLRNVLRRKLANVCDAEDVAHDTFVKVLMGPGLGTLREPRAYLTTVAHGLMVNLLRRRDLERSYLDVLAQCPEAVQISPEARALMLETLLEIDALLDGLKPKVRMAFLMFQLEGQGHAAIAARLNVSIGSVRQYIAQALAHCLLAS